MSLRFFLINLGGLIKEVKLILPMQLKVDLTNLIFFLLTFRNKFPFLVLVYKTLFLLTCKNKHNLFNFILDGNLLKRGETNFILFL